MRESFHAAAQTCLVALVAAVGACRLAGQVAYYDGCKTYSFSGAANFGYCLERRTTLDARRAYVVFGKGYRISEAPRWPPHVKPMVALYLGVRSFFWPDMKFSPTYGQRQANGPT